MAAKDGPQAGSEDQSNYEAAILDFLDKEMADAQSTVAEKKQSEELDALVADLLHQVMSESDQPQSAEMIVKSEDMDDLLAEFGPQEATVALSGSNEASPEPAQADVDLSELQDSSNQAAAEPPESQRSEAKTSTSINLAALASLKKKKNRIPKIAAAACLLAATGFAAYYFSNSGGKSVEATVSSGMTAAETFHAVEPASLDPKPPSAVSKPSIQRAQTPVQTVITPVQPKATALTPQAVTPAADKKSTAGNPKTPVPVVPVQTQSAASTPLHSDTVNLPKPKVENPPVVSAQMQPAASVAPPPLPAANVVNPPPEKEVKPPEAQVAQLAAPRSIPEKPAQTSAVESQVPVSAVVDKKPVQQSPVVTEKTENILPSPPPQVPAPAVQRNLVPAVAISQVSPKFPEFAIRTRTSATVVLELEIDKQGRVVKATPVSGPEMFHKEAIKAAMQWRYRPASIGGTNVSSQVKITFNFNLNNR